MTNDAGAQPGDADAAVSDRDNRLSTRAVIIALVGLILVVVVGMVLLRVFVSEQIPALAEPQLEAAESLWAKQGPPSYDMELELRGAQPGGVHMEVRDGIVTATTRNGRVPPEWTWDTWSVPGMFETLEQDLHTAADPEGRIQAPPGTRWWLRCEFDPQNGVPMVYHRQVTGNGPEVFWRVTRFEVR